MMTLELLPEDVLTGDVILVGREQIGIVLIPFGAWGRIGVITPELALADFKPRASEVLTVMRDGVVG